MEDKSTVTGRTAADQAVPARLSLSCAGTEITAQSDAEKEKPIIKNPTNRIASEEKDKAHEWMQKFHSLLTQISSACELFSCYPDVLLKVLSCLTVRDLCRLRVTSKSLDELVRSEHFWGLLPADCAAKSKSTCSYGALVVIKRFDGDVHFFPTLKDLYISWNTYNHAASTTSGSCTATPLLRKICGDSMFALNASRECMQLPYYRCIDLEYIAGVTDIRYHELVVSSAGGLLCLLLKHPDHETIESVTLIPLVVNPLTGTSRLLPPTPPTRGCHQFKLETKHEIGSSAGPNHYFVMAKFCGSIQYADCYPTYAVYNSRTESWSRLHLGDVDGMQKTLSLRRIQEADVFDSHIRSDNLPDLRGYDAESGKWLYFPHTALPRVPQFCNRRSKHILFRHKRRILYACTIPTTDSVHYFHEPCEYFAIWELQQMQECTSETSSVNQAVAFRWIEVARAPRTHYTKLNPDCISINLNVYDTIVYAFYYLSGCKVVEPGMPGYFRSVAYDLDNDSWFEPRYLRSVAYNHDNDSWFFFNPAYNRDQVPHGDAVVTACVQPSLSAKP